MCSSPKISTPAPPPAAKPIEALKEVTQDVAAARDNTLRRMASRLTLAKTNATGPGGLSAPAAVTGKKLLGE